jgi:hypothetical protein
VTAGLEGFSLAFHCFSCANRRAAGADLQPCFEPGRRPGRPACAARQPGELADASGQAAWFTTKQATDAGGARLPAQIYLGEGQMCLEIQPAGATYPLQITASIYGPGPFWDWSWSLGDSGSHFGQRVATAGDINGDGCSDVLVGAPDYDGGMAGEGKAFMFYGWYSGIYLTPGWQREGNQVGAHYGWAVATAGDTNGDHYSDVLVGAPDYNDVYTDEGGTWLFLGSSSGLSDAYANYDRGNQELAQFGYAVASAGDVNGDNRSDILVGAPYYDGGDLNEGRVWLWYGADTALGVSPEFDWRADSNQADAHFGSALAWAGDVNGDGYGDVLIGAPEYTDGQSHGSWLLPLWRRVRPVPSAIRITTIRPAR